MIRMKFKQNDIELYYTVKKLITTWKVSLKTIKPCRMTFKDKITKKESTKITNEIVSLSFDDYKDILIVKQIMADKVLALLNIKHKNKNVADLADLRLDYEKEIEGYCICHKCY